MRNTKDVVCRKCGSRGRVPTDALIGPNKSSHHGGYLICARWVKGCYCGGNYKWA